MYWDDTTLPPEIQSIVDHNKKVLTGWNMIVLMKHTLPQYIHHFPPNYNAMIVQHKSDWIRLFLLKTYGGLWSDISIIYNDVKKINALWKKSPLYDFTGFYQGGKFNGIYEIIESSFILCEKNSQIITLWLKEFTRAIEEGFLPYKYRILSEGTVLNQNNVSPNVVYHIVYYCLQHALQHMKSIPKMNLTNSWDSFFYLAKKCGWGSNTICKRRHFKTKKNKLPYLKLTSTDRKDLKRELSSMAT